MRKVEQLRTASVRGLINNTGCNPRRIAVDAAEIDSHCKDVLMRAQRSSVVPFLGATLANDAGTCGVTGRRYRSWSGPAGHPRFVRQNPRWRAPTTETSSGREQT